MASIYLMLTFTGTLVSKCIGIYTGAKYTHVSICLDSRAQEFYSFGRKIRWFPLIGGFIVEHADSGLFKDFRNTTCAIFRLDVPEDKFEKLNKEIRLFVKDRQKYGYNLIGLIGVMLNRPLKRKNKYFCTEFVASVLQRAGIHDFQKDISLLKPQDFYNLPGFEHVYEGRLCDFGKSRVLPVGTAVVR